MGKASKNKSKSQKIRRSQCPVPVPRAPADPPPPPGLPSPSSMETPEGIQAYIDHRPNFLEEMVTKFGPLHSKILEIGASASLRSFYDIVGLVAKKATLEAFAKIPGAHLDLLLNHASGVFKELSTDTEWISTGRLQPHDLELLEAICLCTAFQNTFVVRASIRQFLQVLSDFCAAYEAPHMPCEKVAESVRIISTGYYFRSTMAGKSPEKALATMAKHGLLAQTLRCFNVSQVNEIIILDTIVASWSKNQRIFRHGSHTGNMLSSLVQRRDGHVTSVQNVETMKRLTTLAKLRNYSESEPLNKNSVCFHCHHSTARDLVCARCYYPRYCSRECQRAHWKVHKEHCGSDWTANLAIYWHQENKHHVVAEIDRVTRQRNVTVQEVFLELDFMVRDGVAPALKDPPEFKIKLIQELIEGNRQAEPAWFERLLKDGYESQIHSQVKKVQMHCEMMSDGELLVYGRYNGEVVSMHSINKNLLQGGVADPDYNFLLAFSRTIHRDGSLHDAVPQDVFQNIRSDGVCH